MELSKFPKVGFKIRIKQLLCKHETMSKGAYTKGINAKKGYDYVIYTCGKCGHCIERWDKKEDWN